MSVDLENRQRNTTWKFNSSFLNSFKKQVSNKIQMCIKENDNCETLPLMLWDAAKAVLRGKIIAITLIFFFNFAEENYIIYKTD